jgi:large subunit ribosomal protein L24
MPKRPEPKKFHKTRIKKGDQVVVIAGRDKNSKKIRKVISVDRWRGKVVVEGAAMIKRHTRPNPQRQIKGGIAEKESAIAISNVMVVTSGGIPTRVGFKQEPSGTSTRRVRIAKKSGEALDTKG